MPPKAGTTAPISRMMRIVSSSSRNRGNDHEDNPADRGTEPALEADPALSDEACGGALRPRERARHGDRTVLRSHFRSRSKWDREKFQHCGVPKRRHSRLRI